MSDDDRIVKNCFKRLKEYVGVFEGAEQDRHHTFYISIQQEIEILVSIGKYEKLLDIIKKEQVYTACVINMLIVHGKLDVLVDWVRQKHIKPATVFWSSHMASRIKDIAIPFLDEFHKEIGQGVLKARFYNEIYTDDRLFSLVVLQYLDSVDGLFKEELLQKQVDELFANRDKYKF